MPKKRKKAFIKKPLSRPTKKELVAEMKLRRLTSVASSPLYLEERILRRSPPEADYGWRRPKPRLARRRRIKGLNLPEPPAKDLESIRQTRIRVIGIGGGGNSIVGEIATKMRKASFVAANTDLAAFKKVPKGVKTFGFGQETTHGLGTGMNSELGHLAAQTNKEKITKLLEGQDLCILIACLGGGAGSGAAPIFAKISRDLGNITYGIFTLPFRFEGEKKLEIAREALEKLKPYLNALTVIPNEAIFKVVDKTTPLNTALSFINKNLADSLEGLIETIYDPGLINIDFADLRTIFEGRGRLAYLNVVQAEGSERAEEAIKKIMANPLYPYTVKGAKGILFNLAGKALQLDEVAEISRTISNLVNKEAKIIFGISQAGEKPEELKITLLATGCSAKILPLKPKEMVESSGEKNEEIINQKPESEKAKTAKPVLRRRPLIRRKKKIIRKKKRAVRKKEKSKATAVIVMEKPKAKVQPRKAIKQAKKAVEKETQPSEKVAPREIMVVKQSLPIPVSADASASFTGIGVKELPKTESRVRRNALQAKKVVEEIEQEMINDEKQWEVPAFLRRKVGRDHRES